MLEAADGQLLLQAGEDSAPSIGGNARYRTGQVWLCKGANEWQIIKWKQ